jgi:hypothetical protein
VDSVVDLPYQHPYHRLNCCCWFQFGYFVTEAIFYLHENIKVRFKMLLQVNGHETQSMTTINLPPLYIAIMHRCIQNIIICLIFATHRKSYYWPIYNEGSRFHHAAP